MTRIVDTRRLAADTLSVLLESRFDPNPLPLSEALTKVELTRGSEGVDRLAKTVASAAATKHAHAKHKRQCERAKHVGAWGMLGSASAAAAVVGVAALCAVTPMALLVLLLAGLLLFTCFAATRGLSEQLHKQEQALERVHAEVFKAAVSADLRALFPASPSVAGIPILQPPKLQR